MKVVKIEKSAWESGIQALQQAYRVFGPVNEGKFHNFQALEKDRLPDLDFQNTRLSAKALIYPQSQVMFGYSLDENAPDCGMLKPAGTDDAKKAVIGIRPCDADAFLLVKRNFDTPEYQDPYWLKAYENTTFVGLACNAPCSTCFCTTAGSGPFHEDGLDVLLADAGDHFLAKPVTEKGRALLETAGWTDADSDGGDRIESMRKDAEERITSRVPTDKLPDQATIDLYQAPFWDEVSFACINCGTCTYLCPTCWCFDIQDENFGKSGVRMRNWDSCMFPLFTLHGSGHNPRGIKLQRVRQRFMHKLKYYVDKYGDGIQCVGCGRCVQHCPVNIDIRNVCERMNNLVPSDAVCEV